MTRERDNHGVPGLPMLLVLLAVMALGIWLLLGATTVALVVAHHQRFQSVVLVGVAPASWRPSASWQPAWPTKSTTP